MSVCQRALTDTGLGKVEAYLITLSKSPVVLIVDGAAVGIGILNQSASFQSISTALIN